MRVKEKSVVAVSAGAVGIGASLGFFPGFLDALLHMKHWFDRLSRQVELVS